MAERSGFENTVLLVAPVFGLSAAGGGLAFIVEFQLLAAGLGEAFPFRLGDGVLVVAGVVLGAALGLVFAWRERRSRQKHRSKECAGIEAICRASGCEPPLICTPQELPAGDQS